MSLSAGILSNVIRLYCRGLNVGTAFLLVWQIIPSSIFAVKVVIHFIFKELSGHKVSRFLFVENKLQYVVYLIFLKAFAYQLYKF